MMRYVLDEHGEQGLVSLAAELRFVRDYLALESLRLGWRLRVVEEIDPTALDAGLPPLTLQPLVENAVVHGIAARAAGGLLVLRVARTASMVSIEIEDDGPGVSATPSEESRGVGLSAVSQRLDLAFAGRAMLKVESSPGAGFRIRIEVPDDDDDQLPLAGGGSIASRVAAVECR
jgi:LytS/YehU family sensor histidine kinase